MLSSQVVHYKFVLVNRVVKLQLTPGVEEEKTEADMLIDASSAFNSINRKGFLNNVKIVCLSLATFTTNCYSFPSRHFVIVGGGIASTEGTTQGDPLAGLVYAIAIIPLILRTISEFK